MNILIKQGRVLDPASKTDKVMDVLIKDGFVASMEENIDESQADDVIDASGCMVMPGLVDLNAHFREPGLEHKETIRTGSRAAARGGYTTVCMMPNTKPVIDNVDMLQYVTDKAEEVTDLNLYTIAAMTAGQEGEYLTDFEALKDAGAIAVSDNGGTIMNARTARQAMRQAAEVDIPVFAHCEDTNLAARGVMNAGERAKELGLFGIMDAVEDVIVARDILLAKNTGARLHLCHCSTKDSVRMVELAKNTGAKLHISHVSNKESVFIIKTAREQGINVTAEVAPHHFTLTEEAVNGDDANFKINPPLRRADDVKAIKEALASGVIDAIATDHAPHHPTEKARPFDEAPFGVVGLETAIPVTITELVRTGILTPLQMVEKMSYNPAKIIGIDRGVLAPGKVADIAVVDPTAEYDIDSNRFASKGKNTPFEGKHVYGKVLYTLVNGRVVYSDHNGTEILIEREVPKL